MHFKMLFKCCQKWLAPDSGRKCKKKDFSENLSKIQQMKCSNFIRMQAVTASEMSDEDWMLSLNPTTYIFLSLCESENVRFSDCALIYAFIQTITILGIFDCRTWR